MKKKKNNKICKAKKRPEPEGSWPLNLIIDGISLSQALFTTF